MANYADNYFRIDFTEDATDEQINEFMEFFKIENLIRIYDVDIIDFDKEYRLLRGNITSAWAEPYDSYFKLVTKFPIIKSIKNTCTEEGWYYYSILKYDKKEGVAIADCFFV